MKTMIKLPAMLLGLVLLLAGTSQEVRAQQEDVSLQTFYDELSPYGVWIQDPQYGYVWRPDVDQREFRPYYSNGRWVMTEYGNTWVSDYDWGWAPFHYGRWVYNRYNQWVWLPDTVWGPAWVNWRSGSGYYGWAPMGPSINVNVNFGIPNFWWVFVPQRNIYYSSFPRYYHQRNVTIIRNTTIINNTYVRNNRTYYSGPRASDIRRATNRDVRVYAVNTTSRPSRSAIDDRSVSFYTPRASRNTSNATPAPRNVVQGNVSNVRSSRGNDYDAGMSRSRGNTAVEAPTRTSRGNVAEQREVQSRRDVQAQREAQVQRPAQADRMNAPQAERSVQPYRPQRETQRQEAPQREVQRQQAPSREARPSMRQAPSSSSSRSSAPARSSSGGGRSESGRASRGGRG